MSGTARSGRGLIALIREDLASHEGRWSSPGFRALAVYRFGARVVAHGGPLRWIHAVLHRRIRRSYGIELDPLATIGRGVQVHHQSGIIVEAGCVVGDRCRLRQTVTIARGRGGCPVLGTGVDVGAGAVIVGPVSVGDQARIGANAYVACDVPPGAVAVGVPAVVRPGPVPEVEG
jgi:serine O-acetyltransferase